MNDSIPPELGRRGEAPARPAAHATVGVVIVTYNSADHLPSLVQSLRSSRGAPELRILVVDNASSDDTVQRAADLGVACIATGLNGGYSRGINVGLRALGPVDAFLILNPDVVVAPECVARLWARVSDSRGLAVPTILNEDGSLAFSQRREPAILGQWGEACLGDHWPGRPSFLTEIIRDARAYEREGRVDWATGAALMVHAECAGRVGPWDETYFLFSEEVDFFSRARAAGYDVDFVPSASLRHVEGGSGRPPRFVALVAANRLRYYGARHGRFATWVYALVVVLELVLRVRRPGYRRAIPEVLAAVGPAARGQLPPAVDLPDAAPADHQLHDPGAWRSLGGISR